jgi:hypothetical protein
MVRWSTAFVLVSLAALASCMRGPGFMQQKGQMSLKEAEAPAPAEEQAPELPVVVVQTTVEKGGATGLVQPSTDTIQVVPAAENSKIAGATAEFPPGTVAIATEITIQPGENIATDAVVSELALGNQIAASATPVSVTSAVAIDTTQPFTVSIPLPDETALRLQAVDALEKLAVLYRVVKVAEGAEKVGYVTRKSLAVKDGFVRFQTRHFGTFQAIFTREVLPEAAKELLAEAIPETPKEEPKVEEEPEEPVKTGRRIWYVAGAAGAVFDGNLARSGGLQAWVHALRPAKVDSGAFSLQSGVVSKGVVED